MSLQKEQLLRKRTALLQKELAVRKRELLIETALEKVRAIALSMKEPAAMLNVCSVIAIQLEKLGVKEIRNVQTAIFYDKKGTYMNYEYYSKHKKKITTETSYTNHKIHKAFANKMLKGKGGFFTTHIKGKKVKEWIAYQKTTNVFIDKYLEKAPSINYYWYSLGPVALGISTYVPLSKEDIQLFNRFRNVFELCYRRYKDIEQAIAQVREAQLEASLEKVRAQALSMRKAGDLPNVCEVLFKELKALGFQEIRNAMVNIHNDEKRTFVNYDYSDEIGKSMTPLFYDIHPVIKKQINQIRSADDAFSETIFKGKDLAGWKAFRKSRGEKEDKRIKNSTALYYYFYSIGTGSIGISTFHAIPEEKQEVLKRFRNVFAFAYRRYMDVAQAEAQARDAQIEVAVERVRAQSMAMHQTADLENVNKELYNQLQWLQVEGLSGVSIYFLDDNGEIKIWDLSSPGNIGDPNSYNIKFNSKKYPVLGELWQHYKNSLDYFTLDYPLDKLKAVLPEFREIDAAMANVLEEAINSGSLTHQWNAFGRIANGLLGVDLMSAASEDTKTIVVKMAGAFNLAYKRFLDLQKAEAQAREARIEYALEKVRSRTMAMQRSDELAEVSSLLFQQLNSLGVNSYSSGFTIWDNENNDLISWMCNADGSMNPPFRMPIAEDDWHARQYESWKNGEDFILNDMAGEMMQSFFRYLRSFPLLDEAFGKSIAAGHPMPERQIHNVANFSQGNLLFITLEPCPEAHNIFKRFAKVFEQTYTRFLDLQKAEAQAREAQIELGLERVRARAMAMQNSEELNTLIGTVFTELTKLDLVLTRCVIIIYDPATLGARWWMANSEAPEHPMNFFVKHHTLPFFTDYLDGWKERTIKWQYILEGQNKIITDNFLFSETELSQLPGFIIAGMKAPGRVYLNASFNNFGNLTLANTEPLSDEHFDVLLRFAKVFDLTYTRFNDLQKAEAQAREARIETSLEKVRSQTMAMHKSEELLQVVTVLADQLASLGFKYDNVSFGENNQGDDFKFWLTAAGQSQPLQIQVPYSDNPAPNRVKEAQKKGLKFFADILSQEENRQWTQHLIDHSAVKLFPDKVKNYILNSVGYARSTSILKNINLYIGNYRAIPYTAEENNLFQRFAQVFEQSYTRFLDLQKAEVQAREAQIQLALERVRARTMAMQKSDELGETVFILFQQFKQLGENPDQATIGIINEDEWVIEYWVTMYGKQTNRGYKFPIDEPNVSNRIYKGWKEQKKSLVIELTGKELYDFAVFRESMGGAAYNDKEKKRVINVAFFSKGIINVQSNESRSAESIRLLERFAAVFEQTYTRFLDLQKAEAQAKEAQIESALERVRSRTMGMQKSEELKDVIQVVYDQFVHLNIHVEHTGFIIDFKENDDMHIWLADKHAVPFQVTIPYFDSPHWNSFIEAKEIGKDFFANQLNFEEKNKFYQDLFKYIPGIPDETKEYYFNCAGLSISTVLLDNVGLYIENFSGISFTEEEHKTLMRFGKVFQQTYTRFNDLKQAELQARESQIELSLERVRAKTMAMHNSADVGQTAAVMVEELKKLEIETMRCGIGIMHEPGNMELWTIRSNDNDKSDIIIGQIDMNIHPLLHGAFESWRSKNETFYYELKDLDLFNYFTAINNYPGYPIRYDTASLPALIHHNEFYFPEGILFAFSLEQLTDEQKKIFRRFAAVFGQTYRRYLDLKKAESQAREAKIETALERVRAVAMSMMKSEDLLNICESVYTQVTALGFTNVRAAQIYIRNDEKETFTNYDYSAITGTDVVEVSYNSHPKTRRIYDTIKNTGDAFLENIVSKEELDEWKLYLYKTLAQEPDKSLDSATELHYYFYSVGTGALALCTFESLSNEELEILKRFRNVFNLCYQRYTDIALAEAQAREARIEAALERVRSKTMAMHNSHDVGETVAAMFDELVRLGITTNRCGILIYGDSPNTEVWTAKANSGGQATLIIGELDTMIHPMLHSVRNAWKNKEPFFVYKLEGQDLIKYYKSINDSKYYPTQFDLDKLPSIEFHSDFYFNEGSIFAFTKEPLPAESAQVFKKFAGVFGQTYRRYLDLKKAEAQAREAQIESVMEKVRARSLAMQQPSELKDVTEVLRKEMGALGVEELETSSIYIIDEKNNQAECWFAIKDIREINKNLASDYMTIQLQDTWVGREMLKFYHSNENQTSILMRGENRKEWIDYCAKFSTVLKHGYYGDTIPDRTYHLLKFSNGYMGAASPGSISKESWDLLRRAAAAFSFAYTRFQDLQNAAARAREAQIELALERVRARTMAMFKSDELADTASVVFQQLINQGIEPNRLYIGIVNSDTGDMEMWATDEDGTKVGQKFTFNYRENDSVNKMYQGWLAKKKSIVVDMQGKELENYFHYLNNVMHIPFKEGLTQKRRVQSIAFFGKGFIGMASPEEQSPQTIQLLERFAAVFDLTYTRFNDLKQAEAQAKEARIETALERVRSRTMAMHKSEELAETAQVLFQQLIELGGLPDRISIGIVNEANGIVNFWTTDQLGSQIDNSFIARLNEPTVIVKTYDAWKAKQKSLIINLQGDELNQWIHFAREEMGIKVDDSKFKNRRVQNIAFFSHGWILVTTLESQSTETIQAMERFASVFNLTFRRFLDLQQAEAQAKEATIEAALEKVRGKAMAMHNSNDLSVTASMVFTELRKLGINPIRCGVGLLNKESRRGQLYSATSSSNGDNLSLVGWVQLENHPVMEKIYDSWLLQEDYFPELKGKQLKSYYERLLSGLAVTVPDTMDDQIQYGHFLPASIGCLYAWSDKPYNDDEVKILKRFASIIDLTFRRYFELQKSETNAKEAVRQAALDRVRADIASMRTTSDLERITPLIWNELTIIGIPFIRCGVFLMDDSQKLIHTFLSTPEGKAIAAFHIPYTTPGNVEQILHHWQQKENYIDHWDESSFKTFADTLAKQGALDSPEQYLQTIPHGGFYLHFLPFLQGMLYVGNSTRLSDEEIQLIQSVAGAFSTAYARYEDFNKLEAAKQTVEKTLTDLKQAQQQLVQSEKMASLGELTAGIAHEIQNPLNFVNNFSEVSNELIEELQGERNKVEGERNTQLENELINDIKQNLEKINHHGKRADAIVKGMLQHSRSTSAIKEPTDINKLADEYLRLAYHGLRAKDKSLPTGQVGFNATLKTDYDNSIGYINIIPQDIGRVILNLITNAFYAVNERKKVDGASYEPEITVSTKKKIDKVEIAVSDNGGGIPQNILDKIFQPFFTTKPTGQGTGLGLSLAYDIVKAHAGELSVETKEGRGTGFIIQLPSQ